MCVCAAIFLAAMSSLRSDVVTQFVCSFVFSCFRVSFFFLLVSLEFYLVLKCFNGVSRMSQGCFKFPGCFQLVLRVSTKSLKEF